MLEVSEEELIKGIQRDNPWWQPSYKPDLRFAKRRAYYNRFIDLALHRSVNRAIILMGPRRVGKTVMLQQLINDIVHKEADPKGVFFVSLDTPLYSNLSLEKLLQLFERATNTKVDDDKIVVFDEIQYLKDWEIHLKVLTDRFPRTRFIASGSAAAALKLKSEESGAGRFTDFFLPPLTFAEFLYFNELDTELISTLPQENPVRYETNNINGLNNQFIAYLNFGGWPEAVFSEDIQADPARYLGRDIIDKVLLRDLPSLYGISDTQELNRLFTMIAYQSGQEISLDRLASSSGVAKNTITKYLEYLEAAFLIVRVRPIKETAKSFQRVRQFKAYLTNPSMRSALFNPLNEDDAAMGAMAETAIFSQWFHSDQLRYLHYARWKRGRGHEEVDLVKVNPANMKPIWAYEIKWSNRYVERPDDLKGLIHFANKHGIPAGATTKSMTAETVSGGVTIKHFPCALHCYQVGRNVSEGQAA